MTPKTPKVIIMYSRSRYDVMTTDKGYFVYNSDEPVSEFYECLDEVIQERDRLAESDGKA